MGAGASSASVDEAIKLTNHKELLGLVDGVSAESQDKLLAALLKRNAKQKAVSAIQALYDAAQAAPEETKNQPPSDSWVKYGGGVVSDMVQGTTMIDVQYLIALGEAGAIPPRWQEVPEAAKLGEKDFWRLHTWDENFMLPLLAFTYCWLSPEHPDPTGEQLRNVLPVLKLMLAKAKEHGGEHATIAAMQDYISFPQAPRTEEETTRFRYGLKKELNSWYSHPYVPALMIDVEASEAPEHTNRRPYAKRGWCGTEMQMASIVKDSSCLWSISQLQADVSSWEQAVQQMCSTRLPPASPDAYSAHLRERIESGDAAFTHNSDVDLVLGIYERGFVHAFNSYCACHDGNPSIHFTILDWGDDKIDAIVEAFTYADKNVDEDVSLVLILGIGNEFSKEGYTKLKEKFDTFTKFSLSDAGFDFNEEEM
jgi:hypothetical protein